VAPIARAQFVTLPLCPLVTGAPPGRKQLSPNSTFGKLASFRDNAFVALNTAFLQDTVVIQVPAARSSRSPSASTTRGRWRACIPPRTLIVVGADAHCTIVESYSGKGRYFTNAVTEIVAGDRAVVDHYKVQREDISAFHVATCRRSSAAARISPRTRFRSAARWCATM
jgi:Fe-S cluster assembly scaffold protein SufB